MTEESVSLAGEIFARRSPALLHHFFEDAVRQWPERTAVEIPPGRDRPERRFTTYIELARQADSVAGALRGFIRLESIVAILLPRHTEWLYSAQLGVLQAGGAYACIDPAFPDGRIAEILDDASAAALITDAAGAARARAIKYGGHILQVNQLQSRDTEGAGFSITLPPADGTVKKSLSAGGTARATLGSVPELSARNRKRQRAAECSGPAAAEGASLAACLETATRPRPTSLAYVIYTSGTTGRPKGVMIEHRSIVNLIACDLQEYRLTPDARVGQSSSAAFDASVEEIWLALSAGATLVPVDDETARLGPDLIPWLRLERLTLFCPTPTMMRAMGCEAPDTELPELSFVYTGGEILPQDLSDRWSKGRRLVNGYGPTECAVTATRADMQPGEPVSIGRLLPGFQAWVLNAALEEVADDEWGELCAGGIGLARGYHNRPDQTAERFVLHPRFGRIYRTGDLVHRTADGRYFYHGRADTQVKIRGYRIELEEIETRLAACDGVRLAACAVQDGTLAAFIVPVNGWDPGAFRVLEAKLRESLPDYMVPSRYGTLQELPVSVGGKLNRAALPHLPGQTRGTPGTLPRNPAEARLAAVFQEILELDQAPSVDADFFTALGGNSLRAAQLVTRLRRDDSATPVTVRDIYEARTVAALSERLTPLQFAVAAPKAQTSKPSVALATTIQTLWLLLTFSAAAMVGYWGVFDLAPTLMRSMGLLTSVLLTPAFFIAGLAVYTPLAVCAAVVTKRCLIGQYRPLRAPVWGKFYLRNWMVQQAVRTIPWWLVEGTSLQTMALRALGARIGHRVHIHRGVDLLHGGWDLLDIGDDVTIGQEAVIGLVDLDDGDILFRPVSLGDGVTLDIRSGVSGATRMEAGASLAPLAWLPPGGQIPRGERWDGIPAKPAGSSPDAPAVPSGELALSPTTHGALMMLARCVLVSLPVLIPEMFALAAAAALGIDAERISAWLDNPVLSPALLLAGVALVTLTTPLSLALEALIVRGMGRVPAGVIGRWSLAYIRVRMKTEILEAVGGLLGGALFWPVWLRLAGMKIGRACEISSILDTVPELVEIGAGTFLADGIYVGGPQLHRGTVTLAITRIGSGVYLGNHVVIPAGRSLPDNVLLGVCTVVSASMESGGNWFGHPPFELPRREVVDCDVRLTYKPTALRHATRLFWELLRFTMPIPPLLAILWWLRVVSAAGAAGGWIAISAAVCLAGLAMDAMLCLLALAVKWLLLGRVRPGQHPFWACWCGRWDIMYVTWESWARPTLLHLEGTLLLSIYLRAMGAKLGKRVVLGPGFAQLVDPDMLIAEDGATVNAMLQAHTFEDRVLKMDYIHVRRGATLGFGSVPLYGADIGAGAYVAPHSVVMKHEHLLAGVRYAGAPTRVLGGLPPGN